MKKSNKIVSIPRFTFFVALCTAIIIFGSAALMNLFGLYYAEAQSVDTYTTVRVCAGDTLWNIAEDHYPAGTDIRKAVYGIEKSNGMTNSVISAGQILRLPAYAD